MSNRSSGGFDDRNAHAPSAITSAPTSVRMRGRDSSSSRIQLGIRASHFARVASSPRVQITAEPSTTSAAGHTTPSPSQSPIPRSARSTPVSTSAIATAWRVLVFGGGGGSSGSGFRETSAAAT